MNILHVITSLNPRAGGPTTVLKDLALAQAHVGLDVTVCTTCDIKEGQAQLVQELQSLGSGRVDFQVYPVTYGPLRYSQGLARKLREHIGEFDIVHVHGLYRFPPTYAAFQARKQNVPYIIQPHGSLDPYLYSRSSRSVWLKRLYERWFDLPNLNAAGGIHYTADDERARAEYLGLQAYSFVVPNALDFYQYQALPSRGALRKRLGLDELPIILFLGRLHFTKGLDILIPAFDELRKEIPGAQLVLVGPENDDYGQRVRGWVDERNLKESVHFLGQLQGNDVMQAYVDADVFVLPSYTENFGMTVAEAMACRLPVVISDQVKLHPAVASAEAGIVTRCDVDEVAHALGQLLKSPSQRRKMGAAGRQLVQEKYTWKVVMNLLTQVYEDIIERHDAGHSKLRNSND